MKEEKGCVLVLELHDTSPAMPPTPPGRTCVNQGREPLRPVPSELPPAGDLAPTTCTTRPTTATRTCTCATSVPLPLRFLTTTTHHCLLIGLLTLERGVIMGHVQTHHHLFSLQPEACT